MARLLVWINRSKCNPSQLMISIPAIPYFPPPSTRPPTPCHVSPPETNVHEENRCSPTPDCTTATNYPLHLCPNDDSHKPPPNSKSSPLQSYHTYPLKPTPPTCFFGDTNHSNSSCQTPRSSSDCQRGSSAHNGPCARGLNRPLTATAAFARATNVTTVLFTAGTNEPAKPLHLYFNFFIYFQFFFPACFFSLF